MNENKSNKLNDDELNGVNGGFMEQDLALESYHKNIECPYCHNSDESRIKREESGDILKPGHYHCKNCGNFFDPK